LICASRSLSFFLRWFSAGWVSAVRQPLDSSSS
jgi:hypothetical protein